MKLSHSVICTQVLLFLSLLLSSQAALAGLPIILSSPDNQITVSIEVKEKLEPHPPGNRLYYSVQHKGRPIILDSPLGLDFKDMPPIARDLVIKSHDYSSKNETWERVWGKSKTVVDHFNEVRLELQETRAPNREIAFIFRAYDDGVALRYFLPEQAGFDAFRLTSERSEIHFAGNHTVWAANYGGFFSHQESEFEEKTLSELSPFEVYGLPLLTKVSEQTWVAITEANLTDWAGMYIRSVGNKPYALVTQLSPRPDEPGVLVKSQTPRYSPWRTMLIGDTPGTLIASNLISNLNEPCALDDVSWITPGKSAWDRWWSGCYAPEVDFEVGMNTATMKYYVELAAEMGWKYMLVDWHWYGPPFDPNGPGRTPHPDSDITTVNPDLDMPELLDFAKKKGVKILVWLEWHHADKQMDVAFPLYEKWGIAGVKIDFMMRDDQEVVNFYHRAIKKAAEHHLAVDFHGAYKPTGISRTYPNLLTREGVLGNEHTKWSDRITPDHNLTIPFTRMLAGSMDFTPGGFRHTTKESFRVVGHDAPGPFVMGTRSHQLAMMVVYESGLQVLCDSPYSYRAQAGVDFLKIVPTTWDETRVLHGQVGDYITIARRFGDEWFIGSMTDWTERTLEIPLDFLGNGEYIAHMYSDALEANDYPDRLHEEQRTVTAGQLIMARMASGGGHVIHLKPKQ